MSEVTDSEAVTAPQPASTPSVATGASVESDTHPDPPAYGRDDGLEIEYVDIVEKT